MDLKDRTYIKCKIENLNPFWFGSQLRISDDKNKITDMMIIFNNDTLYLKKWNEATYNWDTIKKSDNEDEIIRSACRHARWKI